MEADLAVVEEVETQLELHREKRKDDFSAHLVQIEGLIEAINERGAEWFEENIQLKTSVEFLKCEKVQERFREVVVGTDRLVKDSMQSSSAGSWTATSRSGGPSWST